MNKRIWIFIFIIWTSVIAFSQEMEFKWESHPSSWKDYTINIRNKNSDCSIQIKDGWTKDSISTKMSKTDCDSLILFLSNYTFKMKGSSFIVSVTKVYQHVKRLNNPDWILLNGDSTRLSYERLLGLLFDNDSKKYYYESNKMINITDGTTYEGRFQMNNQIKKFSIDSGRISEELYQLNMIMSKLIRKYFSDKDYSILLKDIERDKPVRKEYQ